MIPLDVGILVRLVALELQCSAKGIEEKSKKGGRAGGQTSLSKPNFATQLGLSLMNHFFHEDNDEDDE